MAARLMGCPFPPCAASPALNFQREQDELGRASSYGLIEMHQVAGAEWFGTCPASLMAHPIMAHEREILDNFTGVFTTMDNARQRTEQQREPAREDAGGQRASWRKARWFRNSDGPPSPGVAARESRLHLVPEHDESKQKGGAVASVSEIRAALDAANQAIAEAQAANQACGQKLEDARAALLGLKGSTGEDLSIPMIEQAIEQQEIILQLTHAAIEHNATYGATL